MRPFRFRLRTLIIAVAVLAILLALGIEIVVHNPFEEMYGSEGHLACEYRYYAELEEGKKALEDGLFRNAEDRFRNALELHRSPAKRHYMNASIGDEATPSLGLADALAGQSRYREAEPLYRRVLEVHRLLWSGEHREYPEESKIMEHHAAALRKMGRNKQADEVLENLPPIKAP